MTGAAKKAIKALAAALAVIVVAVALLCVSALFDTKILQDVAALKPQFAALSPLAVKVDGVLQYTQPDAATCGVTTVSVMAAFAQGRDVPPQTLIEENKLTGGMSSRQLVSLLTQEMPGYAVTYRQKLSDLELIQAIHQQLNAGLPVPVLFGAPNPYNKPNYDFHASVVTGLDLTAEQVRITNVYGYEETISLTEFLNRMSYSGAKRYPFVQRIVLKLGLQPRNAMIAITPK